MEPYLADTGYMQSLPGGRDWESENGRREPKWPPAPEISKIQVYAFHNP